MRPVPCPLPTLWGMAEIAEMLDWPRTNTVRLRAILPPPDAVLRMGPIWTGDTINRWLRERSRS